MRGELDLGKDLSGREFRVSAVKPNIDDHVMLTLSLMPLSHAIFKITNHYNF